MKKSKVLLATLAATVFATSAGALVACGDDVKTPTPSGTGVVEVTFDANSGKFSDNSTTLKVKTDSNGVIAAEPATPTYEGYTFTGYYLEQAATGTTKITYGTGGYKFTKSTTVYAHWSKEGESQEYDITFDAGEHATIDGLATKKVTTVNGKIAEFPEVTPDVGWVFDGWEDADGTPYDETVVFEESLTLYAITCVDPASSAVAVVQIGNEQKALKDNTDGIDKILYPGQAAEYMIQGLSLKANDQVVFMVRDEESGELKEQGVYVQGDSIGIDVSVTSKAVDGITALRAGTYDIYYKLWSDSNNWTVYATDGGSSVIEFTITFDAGAGTCATPDAETVDGKISSLPTVVAPEHYAFVGWYTAAEGGEPVDLDTVYTSGTTLYAIYRQKIVITFDAGNGTLPTGTAATVELDEFTLTDRPIPTAPDGYSFTGWYTDLNDHNSRVTESHKFDSNTTLYAMYEQDVVEYTITFNANGGTLTGNQTATTIGGKLFELPTPTPPAGKAFAGWYTAMEDGDLVTDDYDYTQDVTLWAIYVEQVTVTFDANGGTCATASAVVVDGKLTALPTPTPPANSTFDGWYTALTGGEKVTVNTVFEADSTVYARYTKKDGAYVGNTCYALTENKSADRTEYWLGGSKITLEENDVITLWMNGQQINFYIEGNSEGVDKSVTDKEVSSAKVTVAGEFAIYLHKNDNDWSCQFAGPVKIDIGSEIPDGCAPINITFPSGSITFYLQTSTGAAVGESSLGSYCLYTFSPELFGAWADSTTKGKLSTSMSSTVSGFPAGWIFRWGSGFSMQTGDISGLVNGGTYLIKLPAASNGTAEVTQLNV